MNCFKLFVLSLKGYQMNTMSSLSPAEEFHLFGKLSVETQEALLEKQVSLDAIIAPHDCDAYASPIDEGMLDQSVSYLQRLYEWPRMPKDAKDVLQVLISDLTQIETDLVNGWEYQKEELDKVQKSIEEVKQ